MDETRLRQDLERHHSMSYGWALRCCMGASSEAEDVLQTAYLKILEGRARYDGKSQFKTWLFALIRYTAIDARRKQTRQQEKLTVFRTQMDDMPAGETPDDALDRDRLQTRFRQALATLSDRQQEVLHLVFYDEFSIQDAADVMGVSVGSARTHYERGKQRLREWMEANEIYAEATHR